jgi:glucose/arabinose dehydrogenase
VSYRRTTTCDGAGHSERGQDLRRCVHVTNLLSVVGGSNPSEQPAFVSRVRFAVKRPKNFAACISLIAVAFLIAGCGKTGSAKLVPIGAGLHGPSGLKATVYATGLVHASAFTFDQQGHLWVAASGSNTHGSDGVYLIPRAGAKPIKVISGPKGPLGLLWYGQELIVSSLDRVTAYFGLENNHFLQQVVILRGPKGGGENNNLILAPDGRLVMGISASCDHCTPPTKWSGAIVSFKPNGSDLKLYAGGIRAPFGLTFYPGTSNLLASMNQRDDLGAKTPGDWLALVRQGEDWGFPDCYGQATKACAHVPKPIAVLGKHAAAGGVAVLTTQLGNKFDGSALVTEWNLGKVLRVPLKQIGETYTGAAVPFLTGIANPLPVITTSGGAVLVGDWASGTIYRIAAG